MPEGFTLKSVAYVGGDSKGRPMIKIRYVGPTGYHDTIDAVKQ
jgi:putative heme iron utilization protein